MTYLLDTGIIAELASANPDLGLIHWLDAQPEETIYISVVSLAEIAENIERQTSLTKKALLNNWLSNDLLVRFNNRICQINETVSLKWAELITRWKNSGRRLSLADSLSLAIALVYDHTLVTHNVAIFENTGVKVLNPYETIK